MGQPESCSSVTKNQLEFQLFQKTICLTTSKFALLNHKQKGQTYYCGDCEVKWNEVYRDRHRWGSAGRNFSHQWELWVRLPQYSHKMFSSRKNMLPQYGLFKANTNHHQYILCHNVQDKIGLCATMVCHELGPIVPHSWNFRGWIWTSKPVFCFHLPNSAIVSIVAFGNII